MIINLALLALMVADFGGQWRATVPMNPRSIEFVLNLKQNGQTITGTVTMADQEMTIESGRIQDDAISFSALVSNGGKLLRLPFIGKLDGSELRFQMEGASVTATRILPTAEGLRIGRLAGLFRTWGTIKFFHPYLAYRPIDWDAALVKTIPKVEAAKSNDDYAAAVESMLRDLNDPETHVLSGPIKNSNAAAGNFRRLVRSGFYPPAGPGFPGYYSDWEATENVAPYIMDLPGDVRVAMRTAEPASSVATIKTDEESYGTSIPTRELRLLALARFWNTIRYFYGYPDNIADWDAVLPELLPQFESAANWRDYVFSISQLASRTNDSHTFVAELWRQLGAMPGLEIWPVQGKSVVNHVGTGVKGIERGDAILSVNGEHVERRLQSLLEIYPHSTKQAGLLMTNQFLLAGSEADVKVRVLKENGSEAEVTLARSGLPGTGRTGPTYERMASGLGYIDLGRLKPADVDRAFDAVMDAPGLILDMRGYPDNTFAAVGSRLTDRKVPAAIIRRRVWHGPDPALSVMRQQTQYVYPSDKLKYKGRIAVLIDARAISQAEHMCLFLEQAAKVTFIGSPTKGADGDVTRTVLPGGIEVNFAAQEIRHADGRPLQRVGILPDIWTEPTIAGIREGRDEVLAKAVEFLTAPKQ